MNARPRIPKRGRKSLARRDSEQLTQGLSLGLPEYDAIENNPENDGNNQTPVDIDALLHNGTRAGSVQQTSCPNPAATLLTPGSSLPLSTFGDSGFLNIFDVEHQAVAATDGANFLPGSSISYDLPDAGLTQSFIETYLEVCWTWCPVFDKSDLEDGLIVERSPLIANAFALLGSHIRPPLSSAENPAKYYRQAKMLFYNDEERDPLANIRATMLFYWWVPRGPSVVHKDASWWWTSVAIKLAQQLGLHREPNDVQKIGGPRMQSLRRRIWWTLFDLEVSDMDNANEVGSLVFIHWIRLCRIVSEIGQYLRRNSDKDNFQAAYAPKLVGWLEELPPEIRLDISKARTPKFRRDVHNLHLPYLAALAIIHMNQSSNALPDARTVALIAASCIARIFRDLLARGHVRFLGAISCWYAGIAILALLQTQRTPQLANDSSQDIQTLRMALEQIGQVYPSAHIFILGFQRLFHDLAENPADAMEGEPSSAIRDDESLGTFGVEETGSRDGRFGSYFPFATQETSGLAASLLARSASNSWLDLSWVNESWLNSPTLQLQAWLDDGLQPA
ncbi:hypothetical protein PRZ48_007286 [Zasmidium cellare]|uniref:Xylanolytic transcriptional activator regulatory domain-containing protein n=1 Tax=Zasmidium cellare TaxID=395010 RepID=A0ABR0EJ60_ZASCE|nr:hypothetical protein PRZ48_007286 [Zasmidium cellare]